MKGAVHSDKVQWIIALQCIRHFSFVFTNLLFGNQL